MNRCADCGGLIHVARRKDGSENAACSRRKNLGPHACKNSLRRPVESVDAAVVEWIGNNVLDEEPIAMTLDELRRRLASRTETSASEVPPLEVEMS